MALLPNFDANRGRTTTSGGQGTPGGVLFETVERLNHSQINHKEREKKKKKERPVTIISDELDVITHFSLSFFKQFCQVNEYVEWFCKWIIPGS